VTNAFQDIFGFEALFSPDQAETVPSPFQLSVNHLINNESHEMKTQMKSQKNLTRRDY